MKTSSKGKSEMLGSAMRNMLGRMQWEMLGRMQWARVSQKC